jgi:hypothetical protein
LGGIKEQMESYKFTENADGTALFQVQPLYCLNNIGQRLYDLLEDYRFYYIGLEASEEVVQRYRRTIEVGFPYAITRCLADSRKSAVSLINKNFVINLVEIANDELAEIILMLVIMRHVDSKSKYKAYPEIIRKERVRLAKCHLPELVELVESEIGHCTLRECILSVNKVRRAFVHCSGRVDKDKVTLVLHVLSLFADYSLETLSNPATSPRITKENMTFKDHVVTWMKGENIEIDYGMCLNMVFTVMSFFGEVINIRTMAKYPWADTKNAGRFS